jgi:hypothetical protein
MRGSPAATLETSRMSKLAKFRRRNRETKPKNNPRSNPPIGTDVVEYIIPGFAAFAATRLVARVASSQLAKRYPKHAKHAGAIASICSFAAAWLGAHRVKFLEAYHHPIVVGSGLAAIQSLVQIYLPKLGWILGDPSTTQEPKQLAAQANQARMAPAGADQQVIPDGFKETTAAEWYTYNDAFDAGSYKGKPEASREPAPAPIQEPDTQISDLLDNSDLNLDNSDMGFS